MYFLRMNALKQDLARELPSQRDQCGYALATALLYTVWLVPMASDGPGPLVDWVIYAVELVGVIAGTVYVYRANGGDAGRDFAVRYLSLGWVTSVRFIVGLILCVVPAAIVLEFAGIPEEAMDWLFGIALTLWVVLFYWRFGAHMRDVARSTPQAG